MRWTDSHCHLHDDRVDVTDAIAAAAKVGVTRLVTVGCDEDTSRAAVRVAAVASQAGHDVWATVGLHPHDATDGLDWMDALLADVAGDRVVAIGECGLDYFYEHSPRDVQREMFAAQIRVAHRLDLPLVIHTRDAWDDTFAVLQSEGTPKTTVFHCFSGGPVEAVRCLELHDGVYLSYSGIITFKTADDLRTAAAITPSGRLLIETDTPYLAPVPHRGKRNQPAFVPLVGATVAAVRGVAVDAVAASTWDATADAFRLPC